MPDRTTVSIHERESGDIVAIHEATGLRARGTNTPVALATLAQKLEIELLSEHELPNG